MAIVDSVSNAWIAKQSELTMQIYREIMEETVKKSKDIVLQAELIWIFQLSG